MRVAGTVSESVVDGPGVRYVLFLQGCPHHCKGCHNPQTWNPEGGYEMTTEEIIEDMKKFNPRGITISGGEPFLQAPELLYLLFQIKLYLPGVNITVYTGYHLKDLYNPANDNASDIDSILHLVDYIIDGPFEEENKQELPYRGSSNQHVYQRRLSEFVMVDEQL